MAMYLPLRGSHLTIWLLGSKHFFVMSSTVLASCIAWNKKWPELWNKPKLRGSLSFKKIVHLKCLMAELSYLKNGSNLLSRDDWLKSSDWEMNSWIWNKVGLKFSQIDIQSAVKPSGIHSRSYIGTFLDNLWHFFGRF